MKRLIRWLIPEKIWEGLSRGKRSLLVSLVNSSLKILPKGDRLKIKSRIDIIEKMDYEKSDIYLYIDSDIEYKTRLHSCRKEQETVAFIENRVREGDVFYDIGANIGAYSLVAAKYFQGKCTIYAFEPAFMNFAKLVRNLLLNHCQDQVIPLQIALADQTRVSSFNYHDLSVGSSLHNLGPAIDHKGAEFKPVFKQHMLSYRLDDLVTQFGLPFPNHLKIDVDGNEVQILRGAEKTLSNPLLRNIILELEEQREESKQILGLLSGNGFNIVSKHRSTPLADSEYADSYNYIFAR